MYQHGFITPLNQEKEILLGFFTALSTERLISTNYNNCFTAYIQEDTVLSLTVFTGAVPVTATKCY